MNTLKHILAATDLSAPARHAVNRAARLAQQVGAELSVVHAPPVRALGELQQWLGSDLPQKIKHDTTKALEQLADELQEAYALRPHARMDEGDALDVVGRVADEIDAGLVVMGARGSGFLRRLVLGTTAERLLRRTARPVLVVRTLPQARYRRVLLSIDFSPWSRSVLALARQVAPDARWVLCHAFRVPFEEKLRFASVDEGVITQYREQTRARATQQLHALADEAGLQPGSWDACIVEGEASHRLVEQEQVQDADLVVLGKHGHSAAEDLLLGSVTKHLLAEGLSDVLIATRADAAT